MVHVTEVAARPHATGIGRQQQVREYLLAALEWLGLPRRAPDGPWPCEKRRHASRA